MQAVRNCHNAGIIVCGRKKEFLTINICIFFVTTVTEELDKLVHDCQYYISRCRRGTKLKKWLRIYFAK